MSDAAAGDHAAELERLRRRAERERRARLEAEAIAERVTRELYAKAELMRLLQQVAEAQKLEAIGRLARGVAHDFNNLLTVISGRTALLLAKPTLPVAARADLVEVQEAAERASALTRQLLAFSRKQILKPRVVDLSGVVSGLAPLLRRVIGEDIALGIVSRAPRSPVLADPGQLDQVIMNLVVNARDVMPDGGRLTIETANVNLDDAHVQAHVGMQPGPHVLLAVSDNGPGMDAATRERIFEPFFTTKPVGQGTGLGLATVFGIVAQSGGTIWVYSEPGLGTTFKIYLPRVEAAADAGAVAPARAPMPRGTETAT